MADQDKMHANTAVEGEADPLAEYAVEKKTAADVLYGDSVTTDRSVYATPLKPSLERLQNNLGLSNAETEVARAKFSKMAHELNLHPSESAVLHSHIVNAQIKPPDETTARAWAVDSRSRLRDKYGSDAERILLEAEAYLTKRGHGGLIYNNGTAYHPDAFVQVVEKVQSLKTSERGS